MYLHPEIRGRRAELARAVANKHFDKSPEGILFPRQKLFIGGAFEVTVNGKDADLSPNIIPTEGLNHLLDVVLHGATQITAWYVAPFSGNVVPGASLTGATFTATCTEYTGYSETDRVAFTEAAAAAGVTSNDAARAEFTIVTPATLYGCGLLSTQAKSNVAGTLFAAARFAASRAVIAADTLQVKYTLTATSS